MIQVSREYMPDDMIKLTMDDEYRTVCAFVSSEHLVAGKVLQLQSLYFNKTDQIVYK